MKLGAGESIDNMSWEKIGYLYLSVRGESYSYLDSLISMSLYACPLCHFTCAKESSLEQHLWAKHGGEDYGTLINSFLSRSLPLPPSLKDCVTPPRPKKDHLECAECHKSFAQRTSLLRHDREVHNQSSRPSWSFMLLHVLASFMYCCYFSLKYSPYIAWILPPSSFPSPIETISAHPTGSNDVTWSVLNSIH